MGHINKTVPIYDLPYPWLAEAIVCSSIITIKLIFSTRTLLTLRLSVLTVCSSIITIFMNFFAFYKSVFTTIKVVHICA